MGDAWSLRIVCVRSIGCHRPPDEGAEIGGRVDVHYICRGGSPEGGRVAGATPDPEIVPSMIEVY